MKQIVALAVGVALIALAAVVFLSPRPDTRTVALEPIEATPQRVDNPQPAPEPAPPPEPTTAPTVKPTEPLEPRAATNPPSPAVDELPEPSERPTDEPSSAESDRPNSSAPEPDATDSSTTPAPPAVTSSLPVRQTAQGWGVQAGAFKTESNAVALRDRLLKAGLAARVDAGDGGLYRVIVGAYSTADDARETSASVAAALR